MKIDCIINAENEIELPPFVTVNHVEYPAPDEAEDYEGTAPQYWITVDERNIIVLKSWCNRNNCDLFGINNYVNAVYEFLLSYCSPMQIYEIEKYMRRRYGTASINVQSLASEICSYIPDEDIYDEIAEVI